MSIYQQYKEDSFEQWIFNMDDRLESFHKSLPLNFQTELNQSIDSLIMVEVWLKKYYKISEDLDKLHRAITIDGFVRYVGEIFQKKLGGYWDMNTYNDSEASKGPFIVIDSEKHIMVYPYLELKGIFVDEHTDHLFNLFLNIKLELEKS